MLFLALTPFILFSLLLLLTKSKLLWTSLITVVVTGLIVFFFWHMNVGSMILSVQKGSSVAFDIFLIILGAVFFLETLEDAHIIRRLCVYLETFSKDYRIQIILLAWLLEGFLEGTSGFGTPLTIVAPLLVGIGLSPLLSLVVTLLGNSTSGLFGAVGTPIRTGFAGLPIANVPEYAVLINLVGFIVPIFILWAITRSRQDSRKQFLEALPFAVVAGLSFVIPTAGLVFLGQEFATILGAIVGLLIMILCIKLGIFMPSTIRTLRDEHLPHDTMPLYKVFIPYGLLLFLMVVGKVVFTSFNPGIAFLLAALPVLVLWTDKSKTVQSIFFVSIKRSWEPFVVIAAISTMVQLMINSGYNNANVPALLEVMTKNLAHQSLPLFTPLLGAFGSFITGSTTISNIMFGSFVKRAAETVGYGVPILLALQLVGAAAGNMISIADVLPAQAVVGLLGKEREVIKKVLFPCFIYVGLVGIVGIVVVQLIK